MSLTLADLDRDHPPVNEVETALRAMWRAIRPTKLVDPRTLRRLQRICRQIGSLADVTDDTVVMATVVGPRPAALRRPFVQLRAFLTGKAALPLPRRATTTGGWPASVAAFVRQHGLDEADAAHLHRWLTTLSNAHLQRNPSRDPAVVRRQFAEQTLRMFRLMAQARGALPFRDFLPLSCTIEQLREAFAKMLIVWTRRSGRSVLSSQAVRVLLVPVRSAIRSGVFHRIAPDGGLFDVLSVHAVMQDLARADPGRWAFVATPPHGPRPGKLTVEEPITEAEVQRLLDVATDPWMRAVLALLTTAAPRLNELCQLRVGQVVVDAGRLRQRIELTQKGNRRRIVVVRTPLEAALRALLATHLPPLDPEAFLFDLHRPHRSRPPSKLAVKTKLWDLCQRAGVRPLRPHAFRAFVVNYGIRRGATLTQMAAALGHANAVTTGRYYWTDDTIVAQVARRLDDCAATTVDEARRRLRDLRERIASLRAAPVRSGPETAVVPDDDGVDGLFESIVNGGGVGRGNA